MIFVWDLIINQFNFWCGFTLGLFVGLIVWKNKRRISK